MLNLENRRTKIVCTIGPATDSREKIAQLIDAGMNVARINFSHGSYEEHQLKIENIRAVAAEKNAPVAILQDLSGPKVRIGKIDGTIELKEGERFTLYAYREQGDVTGVGVSYPEMINSIEPGHVVLLADGALRLRAQKVSADRVECIVEIGGSLTSHKGINLPESFLEISGMTEKDQRDLEFGIKVGVDMVALSFVRRPQDVFKLRNLLYHSGVDIPVIAKIEKHEAIKQFDEILNISDGIMVARGDLAVEIPLEQVPLIQKEIISKCNVLGKPVITATQMLKSMVDNFRPTRAEAADVANAMLDGSDAVMLSEETAIGKYPIETVKTMHRILAASEAKRKSNWTMPTQMTFGEITVAAAVSHGAVMMAEDLNACAIVTPTSSGSTTRMVARYRPQRPIIALCSTKEAQMKLCVVWGVYPVYASELLKGEEFFEVVKKHIKRFDFIRQGDRIVITAALPVAPGRTNVIKVEEIN
ncbi:MAG: pyruvate kinase [Deferribacteres bacterium]|nr:pyruvate kinase [candidate division KSB1 bacterium]MCB9502778.1 pyruvate kinase [Deferribacteres bacterium]